MRVLTIAPGALHSTYDVYKGYWDAMENTEGIDCVPFNYHSMLMYHKAGVKYFKPDASEDDIYNITASRASRELLAELAEFIPNFTFTISGIGIPVDTWKHVRQLQDNLKFPYFNAIYHTECPYLDKMQDFITPYADIMFLNDKYSIPFYDPDDEKHVYYLPHSFNPKIHYPSMNRIKGDGFNKTLDGIPYTSDVFFCGTAFAERVDLIKQIDWNGIDFHLMGRWKHYMKPDDNGYDKIIDTEIVGNIHIADFYRNTKIALNVHRTRPDLDENGKEIDNYSDAYSIGPRIYEAAACGALVISDFRQELVDVFGDTAIVFHSPEELEAQIRYWVAPENQERRLNITQAAMDRIRHCTFYDRFNSIVKPVFQEILEGEYQ